MIKIKNGGVLISNNINDEKNIKIENKTINNLSLLYKNSNHIIYKNIDIINFDNFIFNKKNLKILWG